MRTPSRVSHKTPSPPVNKQKEAESYKGGLTWGFICSKADLFLQYCVKMPQQASALLWHFILPCGKISCFGVLRSFEGKIFLLQEDAEDEEILDVFQGRSSFCKEKDSFKTV